MGISQSSGRKFKATERKVFDPADGFAPFTNVGELTDGTLARRGDLHHDDQWWMFLAGEAAGCESIDLFSASLPPGSSLTASGWTLTPDPTDPQKIAPLASHELSKHWDLRGGRHCPSYIKGADPKSKRWVERIYYAGAPENPWGPYSIGFLEWNGQRWAEQSEPVFIATEDWEHGSVYEPNLVYADGTWKMWYVAGSNVDDYLVQGVAESVDGHRWLSRRIFAAAEEKVFDFYVLPREGGYEAIFSKVWLAKTPPPPDTGLWWCRCDRLSSNFDDWTDRVQLMTAADRGWHGGPWRPSFRYVSSSRMADGEHKMLVFFDGGYVKQGDTSGFPYAFTLGCLEVEWLEEGARAY
jgi:hypothetical protein